MKPVKEEAKQILNDLSKDELENTNGGAWWEVRIIKGEIYFIFHPYD